MTRDLNYLRFRRWEDYRARLQYFSEHPILEMLLPQEIWNKISRQLPPWSALTSSRAFGFQLDASRQKHTAVWQHIFRNDKWLRIVTERLKLNPVLIGADLKALFGVSKLVNPSFLVLCTLGESNQLPAYYQAFLQSLQPHKIHSDGSIVFTQSGLVLYAPVPTRNRYTIPNIKRLFQNDGSRLKSAYLSFDTSATYKYKQFASDQILGKNGKNPTLDEIDQLCCVRVSSPSIPLIVLTTLRAPDELDTLLELLVSIANNWD